MCTTRHLNQDITSRATPGATIAMKKNVLRITSKFTASIGRFPLFNQAAMKAAASGVQKDKCEWLWVDVACLPQEHEGESQESKRLRGQEIGRQVAIFDPAQESFAWLSGLKTTDLRKAGEPHVRAEALSNYVNLGPLTMNLDMPDEFPSSDQERMVIESQFGHSA